MKKTWMALAALLAANAYAADTVTLYGVADAWLGQAKVGAAPAQTVVQSGGLASSRLGVSVKEDLGNGLAAYAVFEQGLNLDDGSDGGSRKHIVGLSGGFGSVSLGRQTTPYEDFYVKTFYTFDNSNFEGMKIGGRTNGYTHTARINNGIRYDSPKWGGLTASAHVGLGEDKTAALRATRNSAFSLRYGNGPLVLGLAYQRDEATGAALSSKTNTVLAGAYDFGAAKVNLGYNMAKRSNVAAKENALNLGVAVPLGAFTLLAQVGQAKLGNGGAKTSSYGLEGRYALSKRTTLYAGAGQSKISGAANPNRRNIGLGMRHTF